MWCDCLDCPVLEWCVGRCDNMTTYMELTQAGGAIYAFTQRDRQEHPAESA